MHIKMFWGISTGIYVSRVTIKEGLPTIIVFLGPSYLFSKSKVGEEVGNNVVRWEDVVWPGQAAILLSPSPLQTESALILLLYQSAFSGFI